MFVHSGMNCSAFGIKFALSAKLKNSLLGIVNVFLKSALAHLTRPWGGGGDANDSPIDADGCKSTHMCGLIRILPSRQKLNTFLMMKFGSTSERH